MSRARLIKPGFYKNEQLAECSILARFIFPGLWMLADRRGRLEDRPKRIKAEVLPYDDGDVNALLDELARHGLLARYEVGQLRLIQILGFEKHQRCHVREPESTYPDRDGAMPSTEKAMPEHNLGSAEASPICPEAEAEAEADTEAEAEEKGGSSADAPRAARELPTDEHRQIAAVQGVDCKAEWAKYTDWLASKGKAHRNREAGFRNWLRKAGEFKARDAPKQTAADRRQDVADAIFRRGKHAPSPAERDITSTAERVD